MAKIVKRKKALSVSPLKASSTIGAALAFLGFRRSIPMLHGSQGCTAFGKVFFVRHFREPIPLQSTAMDQVSAVMGADDNVVEGLKTICEKNKPDLIGRAHHRACRDPGCRHPHGGALVSRQVSTVRFHCGRAGVDAGLHGLDGVRVCAGGQGHHR